MYKTEFFTEFIDTGGDNCIIHVKSTSLQLTFKNITNLLKKQQRQRNNAPKTRNKIPSTIKL